MKLKTKDFRKNNYFVLYGYKYEDSEKISLYDEDEIICYYDSWEELHKKCLRNYRCDNLVSKFNVKNSNIITIIINSKMYKLATFTDFDEEIE